jgi:hypothetical protein
VQDRDAGDVGDFLKLGLLRWLAAPSPFLPAHRLGVVWCRVSDEDQDANDDHVGYLDPSSAAGVELRPLDPDLYDRLQGMAATGDHSVSGLAACGALPKGTVCFERVLDFADLAPTDRAARSVRRERWFHEAMVAVDPCSLVFLDPDSGLRNDDHSVPSHRDRAELHTYLSEVGRLLERGQSVITCHYADRHEPVARQAESTMTAIHDQLGMEPLATVRASRGTAPLFTVIPHPQLRSDLEHRLGALQQTRWGDELHLYRWHREKVAV